MQLGQLPPPNNALSAKNTGVVMLLIALGMVIGAGVELLIGLYLGYLEWKRWK